MLNPIETFAPGNKHFSALYTFILFGQISIDWCDFNLIALDYDHQYCHKNALKTRPINTAWFPFSRQDRVRLANQS